MLQGCQIKSISRTIAAWSITALLLGAIAAGCSNYEDNQPESIAYSEDGYLGVSNANPNLRTHPDHHTYQRDRQLMRQALREMGLDRESRVTINGSEAVIVIQIEEALSQREKAAIRSDAYLLLKGNVPRYDYRIYVD